MKELTLASSVLELPGIGKTRAEALSRIGIDTVRDLLFHFPRAYEDRGRIKSVSEATDGETHAMILTVANEPYTAKLPRHMTITKFRAFDETGTVEVVFFNQPYCRDIFSVGDEFRFYGKLTAEKKLYRLTNPAFERIDPSVPLPDMVPRYPLTAGLGEKIVAQAVAAALPCLAALPDFLPENIRQKYSFPTLSTAIKTLHDPLAQEELRPAFHRLAFTEYLTFSLGLALSKRHRTEATAPLCSKQNITPLLDLLPYELTASQKNAVREIAGDMARPSGVPMGRILVGDVGCGKTVCAAIAAYIAIRNGHQVSLMAPTEILARQHYHDLLPLFEALGIRTELLLGATTAKEKARIYASLLAGEGERTDLLIGTHALLNEKLEFADLGLAITDEQHRFGALQRAAIRTRNPGAHLLVMSATPIPRTLALVLYGDLDISRITEMPAGRQRVDTFLVGEDKRDRLYGFIEKAVREGGQVYVVCPAIEEDGAIPLAKVFLPEDESATALKNAVEHAEHLAARFPEHTVACLHGKMKPTEKDTVMRRFADGRIDILVSTTVIEVGVNVPNASLMVVENA
ncbi:MAG: ATP-dependent DNA helicase RecG, partial [Clostridia bacterium]|nr:ATP-dependent DNA helicase RecG [Clostridia bacterium]